MASGLLGVNFAHTSTCWTEPGLTNHLTYLYNLGIRIIRVNLPTYETESANPSFRNILRNVCTTALAMGHYVIWGYTIQGSGAGNLTNTTMTGTFRTNHLAAATYFSGVLSAAEKKRFEWQVGNEDDDRVDGTTVTTAQYQAYLQGTLATDLKAVDSTIKYSYTTHTNFYADWAASGLGSLDYFGLNLYGNTDSHWNTFVSGMRNTFGARGYLSEWSSHDNGYDGFNDETLHTKELFRRAQICEDNNLRHVLFCYDLIGLDKWTFLYTNGTYRSSWDNVFANKRKIYTI